MLLEVLRINNGFDLDILEHSLHQLLRHVHVTNAGQPAPHPSSAPLGPTKRRRLAGPQAFDRHELLLMTKRLDTYFQA